MLVPGSLSPCHQPCAMAGSALISVMCANGISSELLKAHSLSAPRTWRTRLPAKMDKSTMLFSLCHWRSTIADVRTLPSQMRHRRRSCKTDRLGRAWIGISSSRIPIRVRGPTATLEALRRSPLVKALSAYLTLIERIPQVAAVAKPMVLRGVPAQSGDRIAWAGWLVALVLIGLAINNNRLVVRDGAQAGIQVPLVSGFISLLHLSSAARSAPDDSARVSTSSARSRQR